MDTILGQAIFLVFCFILSCFFMYTISRSRRSSTQAPPGPPRLPIIGNIHLLGKNPHRSCADLSKTYGPVMSLKLGCLNSVVISSPEAAREVLKTHDQILSSRYFSETMRSINHHEFSIALLHPSSPCWRLLRKLLVTELFSSQRIEATKILRMKKVQELVNFINERSKREEAVDISRASFITALNIISNSLFSVDLGDYDSKKSSVFQDMVTHVAESVRKPDLANFFPFMRYFDLQGNRKALRESSEKLFRVLGEFYDDRIANDSSRNNKDALSRDFVDALIDLNQGGEAKLNIEEIERLLADLFVAGTDTTSSTVEWGLAELLRNPHTMTKVQEEINRVIGQNGIVEESDIPKLPYLQAVVKEIFRLHPAAPLLLPRKSETEVEILGFFLPKNTQVLVNVWAIGRDPSVWENPNQFNPERFVGKDIDVKGSNFELTPFGAGRRICPGLPLAVKVVPLMLASLLYSFDWKLPNGVNSKDLDMEENFGLTLQKAKRFLAVPIKKTALI